jgi:hypothetical protein
MNNYELTKAEKKVMRAAIDKGLQHDFVTAITEMDAVIAKWKEQPGDARDTYHAMFRTMRDNDKYIARRYDGLTGGRYLITVCMLYNEDKVTDEDLVGLREETMQRIRAFKMISAQ